MTMYEFAFRTGRIAIDYDKCAACKSFACVKACSLFGANIFRIIDGRPALIGDLADTGKRCIEDLACEYSCETFGNKGLKISLDSLGLEEYRRKIGLPT
jgi:hypothetical protein